MIDSSRPKTEKVTAGGVKYEVVNYITAADQRYIEEPVFESMEMKPKVDGEQEVSGLKGSMIHKIQDRRFEVSIVSLEGNSENIISRLLALPINDYNEIKEVVSEVTGEKKAIASLEQKKNTLPTAS